MLGMELLPLGDTGVLIRVGQTIDEATHGRVRAVCAALERNPVRGMIELVPSYAAVAVYYDPTLRGPDPHADMTRALADRLGLLEVTTPPPGRLMEIAVQYGGAQGPDLEDVARHAAMTPDEVVRAHSSVEYAVYMIGFAPGFPFLVGLPERLAMRRRDTPRLAVPAGSVAIGGGQTGIYPLETPGGWHIIGRTSARLFRPETDPPTLLRLGDRVRFIPVDEPTA
jgi:inhibitor of KinA